jgi:hypothetical protein
MLMYGDNYPDWALDDKVKLLVTKLANESYLVVDAESNQQVIISYSPEGRMLFNGEDIETEEIMGFVGLLDAINDLIEKNNTNFVVIEPL